MSGIKYADDVFREKDARVREENRKRMKEDFEATLRDFTGKKDPIKDFKRKFTIFKSVALIMIFLLFVTIILGCLWLIKFFFTNIF